MRYRKTNFVKTRKVSIAFHVDVSLGQVRCVYHCSRCLYMCVSMYCVKVSLGV